MSSQAYIIGVIGNIMEVAFTLTVEYTYENAAGRIIGRGLLVLEPPSVASMVIASILVALGGLTSSLVTKIAGIRVEGHGTDYVIDAIHRKRAILPARIGVDSGGSGGVFAPSLVAGALLASGIVGYISPEHWVR